MSTDKKFASTLVEQYHQLTSRADEIKVERSNLHEQQEALSTELTKVENLLLGIWDLLDEIGDSSKLLGADLPFKIPEEDVSADEAILTHLAKRSEPRAVQKVAILISAKGLLGLGEYTDSGIRSAIARACKRGDLERVGRGRVRLSEEAVEKYEPKSSGGGAGVVIHGGALVNDDDIPF